MQKWQTTDLLGVMTQKFGALLGYYFCWRV